VNGREFDRLGGRDGNYKVIFGARMKLFVRGKRILEWVRKGMSNGFPRFAGGGRGEEKKEEETTVQPEIANGQVREESTFNNRHLKMGRMH